MRTYEDVQAALSRYKEELEEENKVNSHFVVVGGNMCITKKGASTQYILGKGDPIPMIKATAEKNMERQQAKVMGDVKLKIVPYGEWLQSNIDECQKLCNCMEQSLNDKPAEPVSVPVPTPEREPIQEEQAGIPFRFRNITLSCPTCPCGINNCMSCRFCKGVRTETYPWTITCEFVTQ